MKILVATQKPFAAKAVKDIKEIVAGTEHELVLLEKYAEQSDFVNAVKDVDAIIIRSDKVTPEVIEAAENLKIVVRAGAGYDNVNLEAATKNNVVVMNTPGQNSNAVAELVLGMLVYMARGQFNGKSGSELYGKSIGIHAYGNVGKNVARIAEGFGMKVYGYDPFVDAEVMKKDNVEPVEDVNELYGKCEYISLHLPFLPVTKESINYDLMMQMKPGATIVNTARKEVVNEADLLKVLSEREDFKYVSDIAPVIKDELLEKYPERCYFTPKKMGAQTLEANVNAGVAAVNQIIAYFQSGDTTFQVNK